MCSHPPKPRQVPESSAALQSCPHTLADGRLVTIRPIRATDADRERAFIAALSEDSRYARFQKWIAAPSDRLVHYLTTVDQSRHVALVCTFDDGGAERIVGEGRYVVQDDGASCEFGIVIADDWRKSGIAGLLMLALIDAARQRGLRRMLGLVLHTNRAMLKFARALGFRIEAQADDRETIRIVKEL